MAQPTDPAQDPLLRDVPTREGYKVLDGRYVLYSTVGRGGMGVVYRGKHLRLDLDVAIKCLSGQLVGDDQGWVQRLEKEARSAVKLDHPNVVRVYDVSESSGVHYLVMQFIQGEDARKRVKRKGTLAIEEAVQIALGAARGLAAAHEAGMVHRDVKPENILISAEGEVKVADMGLAKSDESLGLTMTGATMGTPLYMPPEQFGKFKDVDPSADVYSLGATLYYLLTGEDAAQADSLMEVLEFVKNQPFPDPRDKRPHTPPALAELVAVCTRKDASERPQTAGEVVELLEEIARGSQVHLSDPMAGSDGSPGLLTPPPAETLARIKVAIESGDQTAAIQQAGGAGPTVASGGPTQATGASAGSEGAAAERKGLSPALLGAGLLGLVLLGALLVVLLKPGEEQSLPPKLLAVSPARGASLVAGSSLQIELEFDQALREAQLEGEAMEVRDAFATLDVDVPEETTRWQPEVVAVSEEGERAELDLRYEVQQPIGPGTRTQPIELTLANAERAMLEVDKERWYSIAVEEQGALQFSAGVQGLATSLRLLDANYNLFDRARAEEDGAEAVIARPVPAGTWLLHVRAAEGNSGREPGELVVLVRPAGKPGSSREVALPLNAGAPWLGEMSGAEPRWFRFEVARDGFHRLATTGSERSLSMVVYGLGEGGEPVELARAEDGAAGEGAVLYRRLTAGAHFLKLTPEGGGAENAARAQLAIERLPSGERDGSSIVRALGLESRVAREAELPAGGELWFAFMIGADGERQLGTDGSQVGHLVELFDTDGVRVARGSGESGRAARIAHELSAGTWYARVRSDDERSGSVRLMLDVDQVAPVEPEQDLWASATSLSLGQPHRSRFAGGTSRFTVEIPETGNYAFSTEGSEFDTVLTLLDTARLEAARDDDGGEGTSSRITGEIYRPGTWHLEVTAFGEGSGELIVLVDTYDSGATTLFEGVPAEVALPADSEAWFELEVPRAAFYTLTADAAGIDPVLTLFDRAMNEVELDDDDGPGVNSRIERLLSPGVWILNARSLGGREGSLSVLAQRQTAGQNDGSNLTRAVPLRLGQPHVAPYSGDVGRWYALDVATAGEHEVRANLGGELGVSLSLYDGQGVFLDSAFDREAVLRRQLPAGRSYAWVQSFVGLEAPQLTVLASTVTRATGVGSSPRDAIALRGGEVERRTYEAGEMWFSFEVELGGEYAFTTEGSGFDTMLRLMDSSGTELASDDDGGPGTTSLIQRSLFPGTYLLAVQGYRSSSGNLSLLARSEGRVVEEAGTSAASAVTLVLDRPATFAYEGGERWYRFELAEAALYRVHTEGSNFDTVLTLYDESGAQLARDDDGGTLLTSALEQTLLPGEYYAMVRAYGTTSGGLHIALSRTGEATAGGESRASAIELELGMAYEDAQFDGAERWFQLDTRRAGTHTLTTDGSDFDTVLVLSDAGGNELARDDDGGEGLQSLLAYDLQADSTYFLAVRGFASGTGSLRLLVRPGTPESGSGSSRDDAILLQGGGGFEGEFGGDPLWFRFDAERSASHTLSTNGSSFDTVITLRDATGNQIQRDDDGGNGLQSLITRDLAPGTYYVEVTRFGSGTGNLVLTLDDGTEFEAPAEVQDGMNSATPLAIGGTANANLPSMGELWHSVQVDEAGVFVIETIGSDFDTRLQLFSPEGQEVASDDDGGPNATSVLRETMRAGTWYVRSTGFGNASGALVLSARREADVPEQGAGPAPNASREDALPLALEEPYEDRLQGAELWFRVEIEETNTYEFHTNGSSFDTVIELLDENARQLARDDDGGDGTCSRIIRTLEAGTYFVKATPFGQGGGGQLFLEARPDPRGPAVVPNERESAIELTFDETWTGMYGGGNIWYGIDLPRPGDYEMSTAGSEFDTVLDLYDSRGNQLASDDDGGGDVTSLLRQRLAPGRYYLRARALSSGTGELNVRFGTDEEMAAQRAGMRTAAELIFEQPFEERLEFGSERWLRFELEEAGVVTIHTIGSSFDTRLWLHDANGAELAYDDDGGEGVTSSIQATLQRGSYFARVAGFGNAGGELTVQLEEGEAQVIETPVGTGEGAERGRAIEIEVGQQHSSHLASGQRWFVFEAEVPAGYRMTTNGSSFDTVLTLYDGNGREITSDDDGGDGLQSLINRDLSEGTYYLMVRGFGANTGDVELVVTSDAPPPPDGSSFTRALDLELEQEVRVQIESGDERWYRIQVQEAGVYVLTTAGSDFDTRLALVDAEGNQVEMDDDDGPGTTSQISRELSAGAWYLKGYGYGSAAGELVMRAGASE